jgi:hypothetical protein
VIALGIGLVVLGAYMMAWSRRLSRVDPDGDESASAGSLSVFLLGCAAVAVGAVIVTDWWVG